MSTVVITPMSVEGSPNKKVSSKADISSNSGALTVTVTNVILPTSAMTRRIKLWALTEGFIAVTPSQIDPVKFSSALESSGDHILAAIARLDLQQIEDWNDLIEVLHNCEQMYEENSTEDIFLDVTVQSMTSECEDTHLIINSKDGMKTVISEMCQILGQSKEEVASKFAKAPAKYQKSLVQQTIEHLQNDFRDAEDIVSYQEYIIDELRHSIEAIVEAQAREAEENEAERQRLNQELRERLHPHVKPEDTKHQYHNHHEATNQLPSFTPPASPSRFGSAQQHQTSASPGSGLGPESDLDFDEEFNQVDKDGDGIITKEEWRIWIEEKKLILRAHNQEKLDLVNELRALRKSLVPESKELYEQLFHGEKERAQLEEELVKVTMNLETSQKSLAKAKRRVLELETEKQLAMQHWKDKITEIASGMAEVYSEEKGIQCPEQTIDPLYQRAQLAKESLRGVPSPPVPNEHGVERGWLKPFLAAQVLRNAASNYDQMKQAMTAAAANYQQQQAQNPRLAVVTTDESVVSSLTRGTPNPTPRPPATILKAAPKQMQQRLENRNNNNSSNNNRQYHVSTSRPINDVLNPDNSSSPMPKTLLGRPTHLFPGAALQPSDHPLGPGYSPRTQSNYLESLEPTSANRRVPSPRKDMATGEMQPSPVLRPERLRAFGASSGGKYSYTNNTPDQGVFSPGMAKPPQPPAPPSVPSYMQPLQRSVTAGNSNAAFAANSPVSALSVNPSTSAVKPSTSPMRSAGGSLGTNNRINSARATSPSRNTFAVPTQSSAQKQRPSSPTYSSKSLYGWK